MAKKQVVNKADNSENISSKNGGFMAWLISMSVKLALIFVFTIGLYSIYLDAKVHKAFEGQRWQLPIQVYGKVETLSVKQVFSVNRLAEYLRLSGYRKVATITQPGQFSQSTKAINFYRRTFDFGHGVAPEISVRVVFEDNKISQLLVEQKNVAKVTLEPILVERLVFDSKEDRVLVNLEAVPEKLLDTLLLVEDRDFYFHAGVSPLGILRALISNLRAGRTVQGGSTLTQQLVKNMFLTREKSLWRKTNEALIALILEQRFSKDQLLEAYINEVYLGQHYGNGIYGFGLATEFYFGKNIAQLNVEQMAFLIGQVKGPSYYDPWRHPKRARERRDLVLRLMFEHHLLSRAVFEQAVESPLSVRSQRRLAKKKYPAYLQLVKNELQRHVAADRLQSGIRVFTGFSHQSQQHVEQTVVNQLAQLENKYQQQDLQASMLITDIASGEIRALVGGRETGYAGFNRALNAQRPIGSLIKPVIYLAALERYEQYNFATVLEDKSVVIKNNSGSEWQPKNYDGKYRGQVPLIDGLVQSLNIPTVNLGLSLGLDNIAKAMHLLGYNKDVVLRPSMLLGALEMSPLEVTQLYLPIAAQGKYQPIHTVTLISNNEGEILWQFDAVAEQRLSTNGAYLLDFALTQVTKTGTARSLSWRLPNKVLAGKTGTSNDLRDSWFIGYDQQHLVTTWLGKDDNTSMALSGSSGALVLFADFMKRQGVVNRHFAMPDEIAMTTFERGSGHAVTENCHNIHQYPAITAGIFLYKACKEKQKKSWLQRLFGE